MVEKCIICGSTPSPNVQRYFHRIPYNAQLSIQWLSLISNYLGKYTSRYDSVVCSDHFSPEDYDCRNIGILKQSAVPILPNSYNRSTEQWLENQHQNGDKVDVEELITNTTIVNNLNLKEEENNIPKEDLDQFILKIESSEEIIKDENIMNVSCNESTNTSINQDVQMMPVENVALLKNSELDSMVQKTKPVQMESTFGSGTKSINAINSLNILNENHVGMVVTVGNIVAQVVPTEVLTEEEEFAEAEKAFTNELNYYMHRMKAIVRGRENRSKAARDREKEQFKDRTLNLESRLIQQNLYVENLRNEKKLLKDYYEDKLRACHTEIEILRDLVEKSRFEKLLVEDRASLEKSLDRKTSECLEHKGRLLSLSQELATVKVNLLNCKEEKVKLEKNLGLAEMRKEIEVLKKRYHDASESCRLMTIKENKTDLEVEKLKEQLGYAMEVCRLVGVRREDIVNMDKVEEKLRVCLSKDNILPKRWKSQYVARKLKKEEATKLAKKEEECRKLKKELKKLRDESGNVSRLIDVCEYCGM